MCEQVKKCCTDSCDAEDSTSRFEEHDLIAEITTD
jgi:hypothetical protein